MNFDPSICFSKIWKSIETPISKVGIHLGVSGVIPSHSFAFLGVWVWLSGYTLGPHLSMPCLGHEPKAKVVTHEILFLQELKI
jgi:hypothetical protein